jgi:hypothetical protein
MSLFPSSVTRHDRLRAIVWIIAAILAAEIVWFAIG